MTDFKEQMIRDLDRKHAANAQPPRTPKPFTAAQFLAMAERIDHTLDPDHGAPIAAMLRAAAEAAEEAERMRLALLSSPCPAPVRGIRTVAECISAKECGCDNRAALAPAEPTGDGG